MAVPSTDPTLRRRAGPSRSPSSSDLLTSENVIQHSPTSDGPDPDNDASKYSRSHRRRPSFRSDPVQSLSGLFDSISDYLEPENVWGMAAEPTLAEDFNAKVKELKRRQFLEQSYADIRRQMENPDPISSDGPTKGQTAASADNSRSTDVETTSPDPELLAYIHHVIPADTLAGISIRYGCSVQFIRKSNRMWPGDIPQSRSLLVIPLSGCSVRGQPRAPPGQVADLLTEDFDSPTKSSDMAGSSAVFPDPLPATRASHQKAPALLDVPANSTWPRFPTDPTSPDKDSPTFDSADCPWTHESWVTLPSSGSSAVEVVRLPSRTISTFPRSPRRAQPSSSGDRTPDRSAGPARTEHILAPSSLHFTSPPRWDRHRRSQNSTSQRGLLGVPGVGSLHEKTGGRSSGSATDPVTRFLEQVFPGMAPPTSSNIGISALPSPTRRRRTSRATERERAWSSVSAASAASALSGSRNPPSPVGGSDRSGGVNRLGGSSGNGPNVSPVVAKGLSWVKRLADRASTSVGNVTRDREGNELSLFSWLEEDATERPDPVRSRGAVKQRMDNAVADRTGSDPLGHQDGGAAATVDGKTSSALRKRQPVPAQLSTRSPNSLPGLQRLPSPSAAPEPDDPPSPSLAPIPGSRSGPVVVTDRDEAPWYSDLIEMVNGPNRRRGR